MINLFKISLQVVQIGQELLPEDLSNLLKTVAAFIRSPRKWTRFTKKIIQILMLNGSLIAWVLLQAWKNRVV